MASRKTSRRISIKQVDAFTDTPLSGNPAGVVLNAAGLSDTQMQHIAREFAVSETVFVLPATTPAADIRLRWFTPQTEVPLCGHATVAAFHALAEEGLHDMGARDVYVFRVETKSGVLPVQVDKTNGSPQILMGLQVPEFIRAGQYKLDVMRILSITLEDFENRLPIVIADSLYVPIRRLHTIFGLRPNLFALSQFLANRKLSGLCAFTTETVDRTSSVHSRFFAPSIGINEDPVTGSANGPLGVYLYDQGLIEANGDTVSIVGEQGDAIGRRGRVDIRLGVKNSEVQSLHIGGRAVTILDGEMTVA
jgi:trans-2,3-dihydro-3-hydroxyanthranilate isomerase